MKYLKLFDSKKYANKYAKIDGDYERLSNSAFSHALADVPYGDYVDLDVDKLSKVFPTSSIERLYDVDDNHYYLIFRIDNIKCFIYEITNEYYYISFYIFKNGQPSYVMDIGGHETEERFFKCDQDTGLIKCIIDNISR